MIRIVVHYLAELRRIGQPIELLEIVNRFVLKLVRKEITWHFILLSRKLKLMVCNRYGDHQEDSDSEEEDEYGEDFSEYGSQNSHLINSNGHVRVSCKIW